MSKREKLQTHIIINDGSVDQPAAAQKLMDKELDHQPLHRLKVVFERRPDYCLLEHKNDDMHYVNYLIHTEPRTILRRRRISKSANRQARTCALRIVSAHLMRVTETAHRLEWQDWVDPILKEPFPVVAGPLQIPNRAGIGVE